MHGPSCSADAHPSRSSPLRRSALATVAALVGAAAALSPASEADAHPRRKTRSDGYPAAAGDSTDIFLRMSDLFVGGNTPAPETWLEEQALVDVGAPQRLRLGPLPLRLRLASEAGTTIDLAITRVSGALPDVLWVQDAEGRAWTPETRVAGRTLHVGGIPSASGGMLDVILSPTATPRSTVDVVADSRPTGNTPAYGASGGSPWAPGVLVATPPAGVPCDTLSSLGMAVVSEGDGYVVLEMPADRHGFEWLDAETLAALCGSGYGFEPDAYAEPPEGSQTNQAVVGSEFGRIYMGQPGTRMIGLPPRGRALDGAGTTIAILDTGVDPSHPRFAGRILPGFDFVDGDDDPREVENGLDDDGDGNPDDGYGHGTIVAGIALCIAPKASILPVRVLDDEGLGTATRVAEGVRWAVDHDADVINMSLGTRAWSGVLEAAVAEAVARGAIVIVSAGNDGDRWSVDFPGDVPGVIAVSALGLRGRPAAFTNGRRPYTIMAPGVKVIGPWPGGTWAQATGTSFAAPFASGAAALLRQAMPGASAFVFRNRIARNNRLDLHTLRR